MISKNFRNKLLSFFALNKSKFYLLFIQIKVENFKLKYLLHLIKKDKNKLRAFLRKIIYSLYILDRRLSGDEEANKDWPQGFLVQIKKI